MPYLGTAVPLEGGLEPGETVATIGQPIIRGGRVVGVVTALIPVTRLQERCDFVVSRRNVRLSVIDRNGIPLAMSSGSTAHKLAPGCRSAPPQASRCPLACVDVAAYLANRIR